MRRADRLFRIVDELRRRRRATRASELATLLEVSSRTIYRDMADLMASGVPVEGSAGVGYLLRPGYHMPPLMFDADEIEALVFGLRIVQSWTDPAMAEAAGRAVDRVRAAVPEQLDRRIADLALFAPPRQSVDPEYRIDSGPYRRAIRDRQTLQILYEDESAQRTERRVRPLGLLFYGPKWLLAAWCELRQDFRTFRLDRIAAVQSIDERFRPEPGRTLADFLDRWSE
ncbi:MAG: YafY family protein [Thalassobaculum sp.]|uniref:helix-turn-helix transcriptional regulator n=1 Tax=Thalassobaculum sp. TaxID=2022740 RepID=UPI0032EFC1D9